MGNVFYLRFGCGAKKFLLLSALSFIRKGRGLLFTMAGRRLKSVVANQKAYADP
jgi:hypothetical protein